MSAAKALAPIIDFVEHELAKTYRFPLALTVSDFLMSEEQFEGQKQTLPRGGVFVTQNAEELELGVYLNADLVTHLTQSKALENLTLENLDAFCVLVEELSHFHLLVNRASNSQVVSRMELEWQGEMDKVLIAGALLRQQTGSACFRQLAHLILEQGQIISGDDEVYRAALQLAVKHWRKLLSRNKNGRAGNTQLESDLRYAYRLLWPSKLRLIRSA